MVCTSDSGMKLYEIEEYSDHEYITGYHAWNVTYFIDVMKENKTVDIQRKNFIIQGNAQVFNIKYLPTRPIYNLHWNI